MTAAQVFAIGAVTFDIVAFGVAPLYGISMTGIEMNTPKYVPIIPSTPPITASVANDKFKVYSICNYFNNKRIMNHEILRYDIIKMSAMAY